MSHVVTDSIVNHQGSAENAPKIAPLHAFVSSEHSIGKTLKRIRLYKLDHEWIAATSLIEAIGCFIEDFAKLNVEDDQIKDIIAGARELSEEEMDKLKHSGDDGERGKDAIPFRQELQKNIDDGVEFPCIFASEDF